VKAVIVIALVPHSNPLTIWGDGEIISIKAKIPILAF
jgi:hypothetical protein